MGLQELVAKKQIQYIRFKKNDYSIKSSSLFFGGGAPHMITIDNIEGEESEKSQQMIT